MLDLKRLLADPQENERRLALRGAAIDLKPLIQIDRERRSLQTQADTLRHKQAEASAEISKAKKSGREPAALLAEMEGVKNQLKEIDTVLADLEEELGRRLLEIPNLTHPSVPIGPDSGANQEIRRWGNPRAFPFRPKEHWEIGSTLDILDFERAAKVAASRFVFVKGIGAKLERALINLMLDLQNKAGYTELVPPFLVNRQSAVGTGNLPKFESDLFKTTSDLYLIPTAEVPVTNLFRDEILPEEALPLKFCAYSPCFRSEAGSYGKDIKGLIRQHQFNKVELVKFVRPQDSYDELESLTFDAARVLEVLELPYRVVALSTGDIGFAAAKTYDLEVWFPAEGKYREISSCSNFEDFQARRANIRYRPKGKPAFVHTLNGSGLAVGRTLAAILENFQQADGSVAIPAALYPYMRGIKKISIN